MNISNSRETIVIEIKDREDLNKISSMKLDLLLPRARRKINKPGRFYNKTEPLITCELPAKVHRVIPVKKATVEVNLVTMTLIKQKTCYQKEPR
ncbi:hypothetical protein [Desulfallas thermosapovorans]|uniref:Uncharacterized protein n=1 Tax=Desulfallas thermosapovorans DSM 6562 TaxID=1121431 RepID=A0A5S4ZR70_9FIRM|nr:hypothetical protein [Desulfallas thermosapovorans]TYO95324.1 hypothetical protein LX24_01674 [Desulfallas thermosapovorans DSM 6562]